MAILVLVDGKVIYGDPEELRSVQLRELRTELERVAGDITKLAAELVSAQDMVKAMVSKLPAEEPPEEQVEVHTRRVPRHG